MFNPVRLYMDAGHWVYVGLGAVMLTAARGRLRGLFYSARESGFKPMYSRSVD